MATLILDTDFLSSFLKIGQCDLIQNFYQADQAFIPLAVHRELAQTELLPLLLAISWINVSLVEPSPDEILSQDPAFQVLGTGEQACILLARGLPDSILLISDNKARWFASSLGISVVNIPAFLMACKIAGVVNPEQMAQIIQDLKENDFYEFKAEIREMLLK